MKTKVTIRVRRSAALVSIALLASVCVGTAVSAETGGAVTVGSILPMTGNAAFIGQNITGGGAQLAIDVANKHGGVLGGDVKLVVQDSQRRVQPTISGLRVLQGKDVTVGIGPSSATIPAVLDMLKDEGIPWIPTGSTAVLDHGLQRTTVWRNFISDNQQLPAMLIAARKKGKRLGLVFENNASGQQQLATAKKFLSKMDGVKLVDVLQLAPGQPSYLSAAAEFFKHDYDAILWQLTDATASGFFKSAHRLKKLSGQYFVGTDAAIAGSTLKIIKPYLDMASFVAIVAASAGPGHNKFVELYARHNDGEKPPVLADIGYDATTLLLLAVEAAGSTNPQQINASIPMVAKSPGIECVWFAPCAKLLRQGKDINFDGAANKLAFNKDHNVVSGFSLITVKPGGEIVGADQVSISREQIVSLMGATE